MISVDGHSRTNRARTAIVRADLSRPLKCAIADGLVKHGSRVFDYGCGHGGDIRCLSDLGFVASGWDPVFRPDGERRHSSVVNLGYVVNVIEDPSERCETLRRAWALAEDILIVSARLASDSRAIQRNSAFNDGLITSRGTFQKFFEQQELRHWIEQSLQVKAIPAAPGIFYVFRDDQVRSDFVAARFRRRMSPPRPTKSQDLFNAHRPLLEPLMEFVSERGRLPHAEELQSAPELNDVFGSIRRAFRVVLTVTEDGRWERIRQDRSQDLLVYLALAQFDGRSQFRHLSSSLRYDVKAFFGTYKRACAVSDELLFSLGSPDVLAAACRQSRIGKQTPSALYVHVSALPELVPTLRLYEGCACGYLGRVEGANVIKLRMTEPVVSYLSYPDFDRDPHPALSSVLSVHLQTFRLKARNYTSSSNRPILHRKELFVSPDYPGYDKFARLTRIEQSKGLYSDTSRIGLERGWKEALARGGVYLKGHRLLSADGRRSSP